MMEPKTNPREPDWDQLGKMINELAVRKGMVRARTANTERAERGEEPKRLKEVSYRRMGTAIGKSPTILYTIMDRYHKPSADTLASLADYAKQEPRVDHLASRGEWLKAGGVIGEINPERGHLDPVERKMLSLLSDLDSDEKERLFQLAYAAKQAITPPTRKKK